MKLEGRIAIVTGGGSGIGRSICQHIATESGKVMVCDINQTAAEQTVHMIRNDGREAASVKADVTRKAEVQKIIDETLKSYGRIDILVNNAGTDKKGAITELAEETWDMLMTQNLKGVFLCTQAVMPVMMNSAMGGW